MELDRFTKGLEESVGIVEKWCYALKHMWKLHGLPDGLRQTVFERLFEACEIARFSPDKRLRYEKEMITERDKRKVWQMARPKAVPPRLRKSPGPCWPQGWNIL